MSDDASNALLHGDLTRVVIGAFFETYNELGPGFPEVVARRALAMTMRQAGLDVAEEVLLPVWYRGCRIARFKADLLVSDLLIVEVKISPEIERYHMAQVLHYLKATGLEVGLLVNFGRRPQFRRMVYQTGRRRRLLPPSAGLPSDTWPDRC